MRLDMLLEAVMFSFFCSVSGVHPPNVWLNPVIGTKDGEATLDKTITEGVPPDTTTFFTSVKINNGPTGYSLVFQKYPGMFYVAKATQSSNGLIYLNDTSALDYETDPSIIIQVSGFNSLGTGTATLTISVVDANDNAPVFEHSLYTARISSLDGITEGSYVSTVKATDADSGVNGDLTYVIAFGDVTNRLSFSRFRIDSTGNITTSGYKFERAIYSLRITATDNGSVPLTGTTTVSVCINGIFCGGSVGLFTVRCLWVVLLYWTCEIIFSCVTF